MSEARRAGAGDAEELVRLRAVMLGAVHGHEPVDDGWQQAAREALRRRLEEPEPTLVAFVVEQPGQAGQPGRSEQSGRPEQPGQPRQSGQSGQPDQPGALSACAACAVGAVQHRLGGPGNPTGESGYVFSVATDPGHRRRGYSRLCVTALLGWYRERGIRVVDLRASPEAEPLYRSLGFVRTPDPAMRLRMG